jgi:hypothetical protein
MYFQKMLTRALHRHAREALFPINGTRMPTIEIKNVYLQLRNDSASFLKPLLSTKSNISTE